MTVQQSLLIAVCAWMPLALASCGRVDSESGRAAAVSSRVLDDDSQCSPESAAKMERLAVGLQSALAERDWSAVAALHWSDGAAVTAERAQALLESRLDDVTAIEDVEAWYIEYDGSNYLEYLDAEEIPAAYRDMLKGHADIDLGALFQPDGSYLEDTSAFEYSVFVGEVDGRFVVLDF